MEGVNKRNQNNVESLSNLIPNLKRFFEHIADVTGNSSRLEILDDDNS